MKSINTNKKEIGLINLFKFIFCFFVIAIHYGPLLNMYPNLSRFITECIARIAVPFYFVCTGYFCFQNTDFSNYSVKGPLYTVKRLLTLYLIWTVIYLPLYINFAASKTNSSFQCFSYLIHHTIVSGFSHLWYLNASAFAVFLLAFLLKKHSFKFILIFSGILYCIALFGDSYFFLTLKLQRFSSVWAIISTIKNFIITTRNGLQEGLLFVSIGAYFSYNPKLKSMKFKHTFFILSFALLITEYYLIKRFGLLYDSNMYLFLAPSVFFLFSLMFTSKESLNNFQSLRKLSTLIYLVHIWIIEILLFFINKFCQTRGWIFDGIPSIIIYLMICIASVTVAFIIIYLSKIKAFSFLKKLY